SKYDALQVEFRRRYAQGLQFQTSYVFGHAYITDWESWRRPQFWMRDAGDPGDVTHGFKANVVYDLPFGQGRRFGGGANPVVNRVIGGWQVGLASRVLTGPMFQQHDIRISKRTKLVGHTDFEVAAELLNAFNHPNFVPVGIGSGTATFGSNIANYEVTTLTGTNTSRVVQLVARINW